MYKESYFSWLYSQGKESVEGDHRQNDALVRVRELNKYQPCKGNLLEVGCGYGHVVNEARAQGWNAVGIEYSYFASKMAKEYIDQVTQASLLSLPFQDKIFNAVVFYNVLEHVSDPLQSLKEARRVINHDGIIIFRTPETDPYGPSLYEIDHLWHFTKRNIFQLLDKAELDCVNYAESGTLRIEDMNGEIKSVTVVCKPRPTNLDMI